MALHCRGLCPLSIAQMINIAWANSCQTPQGPRMPLTRSDASLPKGTSAGPLPPQLVPEAAHLLLRGRLAVKLVDQLLEAALHKHLAGDPAVEGQGRQPHPGHLVLKGALLLAAAHELVQLAWLAINDPRLRGSGREKW